MGGVAVTVKRSETQADAIHVDARSHNPPTQETGPVADPILAMEDDQSQAILVERVLRKAGLANPLSVSGTAAEMKAALSAARDGEASMPVLVLLDLHVPDGSGLDVLEWIRGEPALERLPIVMLSSSTESEDINRAFELGADTYLVKPVGFDALADAVSALGLRWAIVGPRDRGS
jgi:DNA-binding response OmpR family regulator